MRFSRVLPVLSLVLLISFSADAKKKDNSEKSAVDVEALHELVETHGKTLATMSNQINGMVDQFQTMNGDIGRNNKKIRDHNKQIGDFEMRLQVLEDKILLLTGQLQELKSEGLLPKSASARFKEFQEFSMAVEHVNAQQYDKAITALNQFKKKHAKSIYLGYAQYWIGESYYMQSDYPMAIKQYQKMISKSPKSAKVASALYRQGLSFYHLQSFEDSKAFLSKVVRSHPKTVHAALASAQISRINNILLLRKQQDLEMKMVQ